MFSHQIDQSKPTVGKQSRSKKCISSLVLIGIISASLSCTSSSASSTSTAASNRTVQPTATSSQGPITVVGPTPVAQVAEPHWRGNPNAKVVIEEWTDLQWPACALAAPTVSRYVAEHGTEVKQVFRHFPLKQHQYAMQAAEAAEAAGEQGKFWEMAERIQSNASQLSPDFFAQAAKDLGLDMDRFNAAMNDHKYAAQIQADIDDGTRKGIASTPTFVINGYRYAGAPTYEQLDAAVKDAAQRLPQ